MCDRSEEGSADGVFTIFQDVTTHAADGAARLHDTDRRRLIEPQGDPQKAPRSPCAPPHHGSHDCGPAPCRDFEARRGSATTMVQGGAEVPPDGAARGALGDGLYDSSQLRHRVPEHGETAERGREDQDEADGVLHAEAPTPGAFQRHDACHPEESPGEDLPHHEGGWSGSGRVREARSLHLHGHPPGTWGLRELGEDHGQGESGLQSSFGTSGIVAGRSEPDDDPDKASSHTRGESGIDDSAILRSGTLVHLGRGGESGHDSEADGDHEGLVRRGEGLAERTPPQDQGDGELPSQRLLGGLHAEREVKDGSSPEHSDVSPQDPELCELSLSESQGLEEQSWAVIPRLFEDLKGSSRPLLMEVCCTPNSILTEVVRSSEGREDAAVRCSLFNGCDLSKGSGVRLVLERIDLERPRNVWISPPCDPYSPLQHLNERTESQRRELEEKRKHAQKLYVGASVVFRYCMDQGVHCTWEWAERCEAWRLPVMQKLRSHYQLFEAVAQGCRVNLRTKKDGRLMKKGWRIVTSHERMSQLMNLPCRCEKGFSHGQCTGQDTARTGLYTKEFAKRVYKALRFELNHHGVLQECLGVSSLPSRFGEGDVCTCGEFRHPKFHVPCGSCTLGRCQVPFGSNRGYQRCSPEPEVPVPPGIVEPHMKQAEPKTDPAEAKAKPTEAPGPSIQTKPAEAEAKPLEAKPKPAEAEAKPPEAKSKPAEAKLQTKPWCLYEDPEVTSPQAKPRQVSQVMHAASSRSDPPEPKEAICSQVVFGGQQGASNEEAREQDGPSALGVEASPWTHKFPSRQVETDEQLKRKIYLLHAATGHGSTRHLVEALKRRQAEPRIIELAKQFRCSICEEKRHVGSRHLAALEPLPPKWATISADIGHWHHPKTGEHVQFMLILDEGSRFRAARVLTKGSKQQPNASMCLQYIREGWAQYFGMPRTLRLDPAGAFRSHQLETFCDRYGIFLDLIPGEAHWKIGACEQAVRGTKELMSKLVLADEDSSPEELLSQAVLTFNQRDIIRGFSPVQHALGQSPDEQGRLHTGSHSVPPELLTESADGEFSRAVARRAAAEKAHADWTAHQRLLRAQNSRARPCYNYQPGELVFFWRSQEANKSQRQPGGKHGRFLGPARILAVETRRQEDGSLHPGGAVWLVRGRNLIKCSPEQLRRASQREELIEAMLPDSRTPWTFSRLAEELGGNQYQDISSERPTPEEWTRAQRVEEEVVPVRHRIRHKRPEPASEDEELIPDQNEVQSTSSQQPLPQRPRMQSRTGPHLESHAGWWSDVSPETWATSQGDVYWQDEAAAVCVEVTMPESHRGWKSALNGLDTYFVGAMKRQAIEVSERRLSPEDKEKFRVAKNTEVRNFVSSQAFEALPPHLRPSKELAVNMRWVLTWKTQDDGNLKAKARAVLLGYQDPLYAHRATTAPVMTRQSRQMLLQMSSIHDWEVQKGDVSGAFLQGRSYPDDLFCIPTDEICSAMNLPPGSVTRLKRACYGLVDAPLEWYRTVALYLESLGLERTWADGCTWAFRVNGTLRGLISGHVDDFLFAGSKQDVQWQEVLSKIKNHFRWSDWEQGRFSQCGVVVQATSEGFELCQPHYLEGVHELTVSSQRRKEPAGPTQDREKSQLRTMLGALSWHAQQVAPHASAEVSLLLSEINHSTVDTIRRANQLLRNTKARSDHKMKIHKFSPNEDLTLYAWVDAASQNRRDGGSTQGLLIGMGPSSMMQGEVGKVTPIAWHSSKIDRVCRSPGTAETQAAVNGEDALYFARYQWSELCHGKVNIRDPDEVVNRVPGCLITDSRNVFDRLRNEVIVVKGAERKSTIEMLGLKESQLRTGLRVRWVHSEAQLSNGLTKAGHSRELEMFYRLNHQWRLVEDVQMRSARKRRSDGLSPLEDSKDTKSEVTQS